MSTNLNDKLMNWLNEQGYPLEMATAQLFRQHGFRAFQSDFYTDPESNTQREIDVLAYRQKEVEDAQLRVSFSVECKNAKDKPWVMFSSEALKLAPPARVFQRAGSKLAIYFLRLLSRHETIQKAPLFSLPRRPGYGVTQAFSNGQDVPFTACVGAAKSAIAKATAVDSFIKFQGAISEIVFPVVLIEGKLFECYLSEDNAPILNEIQEGVLVWRNPVVQMPHTIIHILTLDSLPNFLSQANETIDLLFSREKEIAKMSIKAQELRSR